MLNAAASSYGVNPNLLNAVAMQESSMGQGSNNVMQVNGMENSAPGDSINTGASMLSQYLKQTGNVGWALAMYNMGPGIYQWAKSKGITDPTAAMPAFSKYQQQNGSPGGYGDPQYIQHVMGHTKSSSM